MTDGIPMMLSGDALSYYTIKVPQHYSYNAKVKAHTNWFSSDEKRSTILRSFEESKLSSAMSESPTKK